MTRLALVLLACALLGGCAVLPPPAGLNRDGSPRISPGRAEIRRGVWVDLTRPQPARLVRCAPARVPVAAPAAPRPAPLGARLDRCWTAPWVHAHVSHRGTPFVHGFLTEPAFLGRDIYADFRYAAATARRTEYELEVELEWALTRRLGLVATVPFVWWELEGQSDITDVADLGAGLRALLVETPSLLLSAGLDVNFPTSDDGDRVGANEWTVQPYLATWLDLGAWWTWQSRVGVEFLLRSNAEELAWSTMLARSFEVPFLLPHGRRGHTAADHEHYRAAVLSVFAEIAGTTVLSGAGDGTTTGEFLLGISQTVTDVIELRVGAFFPLTGDTELDWGIRLGATVHL